MFEFLFNMSSLTSAELTVKALPHVDVDEPIEARLLVDKLQHDMNAEFVNLNKIIIYLYLLYLS